MILKLDIDPAIVAMMAGERAVTAAMREAGTGLKTAWRLQITGAVGGSHPANGSADAGFVYRCTGPRWSGCRPPQTASQCAKVVVFKATQKRGRRDEGYDDRG
jgi:hypothetical protein